MIKITTEKTIQELNLEDDFLFAKVMTDKEICRKVLEKILNVPIKEVVLPTTQRTIDIQNIFKYKRHTERYRR